MPSYRLVAVSWSEDDFSNHGWFCSGRSGCYDLHQAQGQADQQVLHSEDPGEEQRGAVPGQAPPAPARQAGGVSRQGGDT